MGSTTCLLACLLACLSAACDIACLLWACLCVCVRARISSQSAALYIKTPPRTADSHSDSRHREKCHSMSAAFVDVLRSAHLGSADANDFYHSDMITAEKQRIDPCTSRMRSECSTI